MGIEAGRCLGFYLSVPGALNLQAIRSSGVVRCLSFLLHGSILIPLLLIVPTMFLVIRRRSFVSNVVPTLFLLIYHDSSSPNVVPTLFRCFSP
jgi:hypothetical protein